jgi:hypothetical protein
MLIRGRGSPKPGIVRDGDEKVRALFDEPSAEIRKDDFKTDENAKFASGQREIEDFFSRFEVANPFSQRPDEEKKILHGDILTKRNEVDLVILSRTFSGRRDQVDAVIMAHFPFPDFIRRGSEEEKGVCLLRDVQDKRLVFFGLLKKERGGCFGPDDKIRFFLCHLVGKFLIDS